MLKEGTILLFTPFKFLDGSAPKDKFFIVLKSNAQNNILASLPTSKDYIPANFDKDNGCIETPTARINCFVFGTDKVITTCGKYFKKKTFVHGTLLNEYPKEYLIKTYPKQGKDFKIFGEMKKDLFNDLKKCLKNSDSVKRKFIKQL